MHSILAEAVAGAAAPTHIVCLPGAFHTARDFVTAGFHDSVQKRNLPVDLTFVDVDIEHLGDRRACARLRQDIVLPARHRGARSVWFAGISLGGFIALDYADTHAGELDGICLLAPYLGSRLLIAEIARAPGLAAWQPGDAAQWDEERRVWRYAQNRRNPELVYLGFGTGDRFARAHGLLADALPSHAVDRIAGAHDWPTWKILWEHFLDSGFWSHPC